MKAVKPSQLRPAGVIGVASALIGAGAAHAVETGALPQNPTVAGGAASFAQSGRTLTVNQSTDRTVIDWRSFDIGQGATTVFNQPNASSIAVNRVNGSANPTQIEGSLTANGQVWILNPNGVLFGKGARVDVAGLLASTANLDAARFMAGDTRLSFTGSGRGQVVNAGQVSVAANGLAAFVAPSVRNSGTITATVGKVALAAGETFTLDLAGDHLVELGLGAGKAVVDQSGRIVDAGGVVTLSARSAGQVVDSVINMSGVVDASSATAAGGQIVLRADDVATTAGAQLKADGAGAGGQIIAVADKTGDYAGAFSARGGALGGDGGHVETSGARLHIADAITVDTTAAGGRTGSWTLDPDTLTVGDAGAGSIGAGVNSDADETISASTVVAALDTTNVTLQARTAITVDAAIDASANGAAHNLALADEDGGGLTVNLDKAITLKSGGVLSGQATTVNLTNGALIQNGVDAALAGATVNLGAGTYAPGATVNKALTLSGRTGARIVVGAGQTGLVIGASDVAVSGLEIAGPLGGDYRTLDWTSQPTSWGVQVTSPTTSHFLITGNDIHDIRTGVLVANSGNPPTGAAAGSITGNLLENTKGGVIVQYRDGSTVDIAGNRQGPIGNEWGVVYNTNLHPATIAATAPTDRQAFLLGVGQANGGLTVLDRGYTNANRTAVQVQAGAAGVADNGFGNDRQPLASIQSGIAAVVAGGLVDVANGTYVIAPGGGNYINVDKPLSLVGESEAGVAIDARGASTYGLRVTTPDAVSLSNFTLYGVTASGGYGLKAEATHGLTISNVASRGAAKSEFDLNGVVGATLDHLTADGASVATGAPTAGNGISLTDSQDIVLTNAVTRNNQWGGLALYQANSATGYPLQETDITIDASNSFGEANPVYAEDQSSTHDFGTLDISGFDYLVKSPTNPADAYTWFQKTRQGAIDFAASVSPATAYVEGYGAGVTGNNSFFVGTSTGGQALSIQTAINAALAGATVNVDSGSYAGDVAVSAPVTLNLGQVILGGGFTLGGGAAGSSLSGGLKAASIALAGPAVVVGGLTLDTSASGGPIAVAALDAATAGAPSLTIDAGSGALSLGALGANSRLGAVQIAHAATLTGGDYKASSLSFGGDVTLTQASTTLDTSGAGAAGDITVAGAVLGSADGAQSLTLTAGPGTGAASANGDISLQNVGQLGLALGDLTVSGDDFTAQTVRIAGDFNARLTGDQVFSSHTLDAGGSVSSSVGGDASGPINASGDVSVAVGGDLTGAITATNVDLAAGSLTGATVNASQSASATAGSVSGSTVTAADTVKVNAGSVSGSTLSGQTVTAQADTFEGTVNAANQATVSGGAVSGQFTGATVSLNAGALTGATVNASQDASVTATRVAGSTVAAANAVQLNASSVSGVALTGATVTAQADHFDGQVNAAKTASVTGGDISGAFTAGSLTLTGSGSVNANVNAATLTLQAPKGNVSGAWRSLDAGAGGSGGVLVNNQPTGNEGAGLNPSQLVVENFALPAGTAIRPTGAIVLPQGQVLGLLSPGGAGGAPKLIQVQTVQELGSLLSEGYTAIVIDLSSREAPAKAKAVKVSAK
jgi:filamentous hemagglutinin family protein